MSFKQCVLVEICVIFQFSVSLCINSSDYSRSRSVIFYSIVFYWARAGVFLAPNILRMRWSTFCAVHPLVQCLCVQGHVLKIDYDVIIQPKTWREKSPKNLTQVSLLGWVGEIPPPRLAGPSKSKDGITYESSSYFYDEQGCVAHLRCGKM